MSTRLGRDLRYGWRVLRRHRGFSLVAVVTLGTGIAMMTVVFALLSAFFLRPLPFDEPQRLVHIWQTDAGTGIDTLRMSAPNFRDLQEQSTAFEAFGGYFYTSYAFGGDGTRETLQATLMTPDLLGVLGVAPALGRAFVPDDAVEGRHRVALISERLWRERFGGRAEVLGEEILLDGRSYQVIGVMAETFVFPFNAMDLWAPLPLAPHMEDRAGNGPLLVVGRLAAGVTAQMAQAELDALAGRLIQEYPLANAGKGFSVVDLRSQLLFTYEIFRVIFPSLLVAVLFVLLIVCANLGNLLLARAADRRREMAYRLTLGATRVQLVRQLLIESLLLAALAGTLGVALALPAVRALELALPGELYRIGGVVVDAPAALAAFGVAGLCALAFGLAPALQTASPRGFARILQEGTRGATVSPAAQRFRKGLVVAQVAFAMLLATGAGLMVKTFRSLQQVDLGFEASGLLTLEIRLPSSRYPGDPEETRFFEEALERIRTIPGVEAAAAGYPLPLNHEQLGTTFEVEGWEQGSTEGDLYANTFKVTSDYFETWRIPLERGRAFDQRDHAEAPKVVVVNRRLAERFWPDRSAVGQRLLLHDEWREVVGVVDNSVAFALDEETPLLVYLPQLQTSTRRRFVALRAAADPLALFPEVERQILALDPEQPVTTVRTMGQVIGTWLGAWMMGLGGLSLIGAGALLLAAMGLYGVVSYSVSLRRRELGIRQALGAERRDILRLVVGQGMKLAGLGVALGLVGAGILTRFLQALLFGVGALDPLTFAGTALLLLATAGAASLIPARRASRVEPMAALRYE